MSAIDQNEKKVLSVEDKLRKSVIYSLLEIGRAKTNTAFERLAHFTKREAMRLKMDNLMNLLDAPPAENGDTEKDSQIKASKLAESQIQNNLAPVLEESELCPLSSRMPTESAENYYEENQLAYSELVNQYSNDLDDRTKKILEILEKNPSDVISSPEKSLLKPQPTTPNPDIFENNFFKNSFRQQHFPLEYQKWFSEITPKRDPFPANLMVCSYPKLSLTGQPSHAYTPCSNTATSTISAGKFSYKGQTQNGLMHGLGTLQMNQEDSTNLAAGLMAIIKTPPLKIIKLTYEGKFKSNKFDGQGN